MYMAAFYNRGIGVQLDKRERFILEYSPGSDKCWRPYRIGNSLAKQKAYAKSVREMFEDSKDEESTHPERFKQE